MVAITVAVPKQKIKYTYEDYKSLSVFENKQYELLDGEIIMVPTSFLLKKLVQE